MMRCITMIIIGSLSIFLSIPALCDTSIVPEFTELEVQVPGVKSAEWKNARYGGALEFERLQFTLLGDGARLSYKARVLELAPLDSGIHVELFAGNASLGTIDFGRWPNSCNNRDEQREMVGKPSPEFKRFEFANRARIYITGGGWSRC